MQVTSASSCWQVKMPLNLHACPPPLLWHKKQSRGKQLNCQASKLRHTKNVRALQLQPPLKKKSNYKDHTGFVNFRNASAQSPRVAAKLPTFARQYQLFLLAAPFVSDSYWVLLLKMSYHWKIWRFKSHKRFKVSRSRVQSISSPCLSRKPKLCRAYGL